LSMLFAIKLHPLSSAYSAATTIAIGSVLKFGAKRTIADRIAKSLVAKCDPGPESPVTSSPKRADFVL
jgi:hypothetical protein